MGSFIPHQQYVTVLADGQSGMITILQGVTTYGMNN
jgi:hypothetical protein